MYKEGESKHSLPQPKMGLLLEISTLSVSDDDQESTKGLFGDVFTYLEPTPLHNDQVFISSAELRLQKKLVCPFF